MFNKWHSYVSSNKKLSNWTSGPINMRSIMMEEGHLSMCYFYWIIKKLPWPFDRTENYVGRVNRTECWEEEGNEADTIALLSKMDAG